jgi:hypothetical protein
MSESDPTTSTASDPPQRIGRIGPDHRDLYLLILGIVVGMILGPWVLGKFADGNYYRQWFRGYGGPADAELQQFDDAATDKLKRLADTGVTQTAIDETQLDIQKNRQGLINAFNLERAQRMTRLDHVMTGLLAAVLFFMVIESLIDPTPGRRAASVRNRLATGRYALMGIWLALVIARAETVPVVFTLVLVVVGLVAALMPLGWLRQAPDHPPAAGA